MKKVIKETVEKVKKAVTPKKDKVKKATSCLDCGGSGLKDSNTLCPLCNGSGQV